MLNSPMILRLIQQNIYMKNKDEERDETKGDRSETHNVPPCMRFEHRH